MLYYMLNKPKGYLSAVRDDIKKTVLDLFPEDERELLHPVGRLDYDTTGLLLVTDDGMVDQALLLPERHAVKKYFFYAIGEIDDEKIRKAESGVPLGESGYISKPAKFTLIGRYSVGEIKEYLPEFRREKYLKNPGGAAFSATLEISEGRKHQVKLMMRAVGCKVVFLHRYEIAGIVLDSALKEGEYRPLNRAEMEILINLENEIRRNKISLDGIEENR